jgi:putative DNA topoisomerase
MKSLLIVLVAFLATTVTFGQKSKGNVASPNSTGRVQVLYSCPMHPDVTSDKPGKCPKCNKDLALSPKEKMKREVTNTYTCPMHAEILSDHAGTCPKCKQQLVVDRKGSKQPKKVYSCTMHPDVIAYQQGKCPICNIDLAEVKKSEKQKKE